MTTKNNPKQPHVDVEDVLSQSETFIIKNKNSILGGLLFFVILISGVLAYHHLYSVPRENKAQAAIFKGQEYFEANDYKTALQGDSISFEGFAKIADQYSGTKAGNLANAYMGICNAKLGNYKEAIAALDNFDGDDEMVAPTLLAASGNCYAQLGELNKAATILLDAASKADNDVLSPIFLMQAGKILVENKKFDQAVEAYTLIKEKYFNSYQAMNIDKFIEQAKLMK